MSLNHRILIGAVLAASLVLAACGDDDPLRPSEFAPPTNVTMETGEFSIKLDWQASPFAGASEFAGYNVYADTASIAGMSDTTDAEFLAERKINADPITARQYTVAMEADTTPLVRGQRYYLHVRSVRNDGRVSVASNEVHTAPRPQGDNDIGNDDLLMYDFSATTSTPSAYGWERFSGLGQPYATSEANQEEIDFFMIEEPNSTDDGSEFVSPSQTTITAGWSQRNRSLFQDLGAGEAAWAVAVAPDTADMTTRVKVVNDHTYALYLHDGHWAKIRVTMFEKNIQVPSSGGPSVVLNRVTFTYAFQLLEDYPRFKPGGGIE